MPDIGKEILKPTTEVYFPNAEVVCDFALLPNSAWVEARRDGIGGSDSPVIMMGSCYGRTIKDLFYDKRSTPVLLDTDDESKWLIFEYGHTVEPLVAKIFEWITGFKVLIDTRMYRHPVYKFMLANVDRVVVLPDGRKAILECKTSSYHNKEEWQYGPPLNYEFQCRHYMAVCDVDVVYIACLFGNSLSDFICHRIERDLEIEKELIEKEREFWEEYVLPGIEPPLSGDPEKDILTLRKYEIGPANKDLPPITLDEEYIPQIKKYLEINEKRKLQEKIVDSLKEEEKSLQIPFWEALGKATKGIVEIPDDPGSYYEISISPRSRTNVDVEKLKLVYPDVYNEVVTVVSESSRVFSLSKKKKKVDKGKDSKK